MSRGRKPKSLSIYSGEYEDLFGRYIGYYLQVIAAELGTLKDPDQTITKEDGADLLEEARISNGKSLPKVRTSDYPFPIPKNWVWCRLGEITNYGSSPKAEPQNLSSTTWVLDLEDIEKETSKLLCKVRFSERQSLSTKSVFKKGNVLYSKLRPYLDKVIVADEDGVCTTEILPLQLYKNINPYFLMLTLKLPHFLKYVNSVTKGMKMPRLGTNEGRMALIPLPPLSEQNMILSFLNDFRVNDLNTETAYFNQIVEQKIITLHKSQLTGVSISTELAHQLSLVQQLRRQILQEAVQGKLLPQDPRDEPAAQLLQKIKAEKEALIKAKKLKKSKPLPPVSAEEVPFEIPKGWVWCRLGEVIYDTEGGKSPNCKNESAKGNEWGVIKTTAVQEMVFLQHENKILPENYEVNPKHKVEEGDVLITRAGPKNRVGIVCCVEKLNLNLILSDKTIRILHNKELINSKFLALLLNSPLIKPIIESKMTGMADSQVNISQDNMKRFPITLPPLPEQQRIVQHIERLMQVCDALEASILHSQHCNEQLLQQVLREALQPV